MVATMLGLWTDPQNSRTAREEVEEWVIEYMAKLARLEAQTATVDGFLQMVNRSVDSKFVLDFNLSALHIYLNEKA